MSKPEQVTTPVVPINSYKLTAQIITALPENAPSRSHLQRSFLWKQMRKRVDKTVPSTNNSNSSSPLCAANSNLEAARRGGNTVHLSNGINCAAIRTPRTYHTTREDRNKQKGRFSVVDNSAALLFGPLNLQLLRETGALTCRFARPLIHPVDAAKICFH